MYISSSDCFLDYLLTHFPFSYSMSMCKHNDQSAYKRMNEAFSSRDKAGQPAISSIVSVSLSLLYSLVRWMSILNFERKRKREEKEMKVCSGEQCWMSTALPTSSRCNQHEKVGVPMFLVLLPSIVQRNYR